MSCIALLFFGNRLASAEVPILSFSVQDAAGERDSRELFSGRTVVLAVTGNSCSGIEPFVAFQEKLSQEQKDQTRILCIGGTPMTPNPLIGIASDNALKALGLTGTPMILGIEDNEVKWRLAGFISHWQALAYNWLDAPR